MLGKNHLKTGQLYFIRDNILMQYVKDNKQTFEAIVPSQSLTNHVLKLAHDERSHSGSTVTYILLKRLYYWKGFNSVVQKYIQQHKACQQRNRKIVLYANLHLHVPMPRQLISLDSTGVFYPRSETENCYALTVICMLTGHTFLYHYFRKQLI